MNSVRSCYCPPAIKSVGLLFTTQERSWHVERRAIDSTLALMHRLLRNTNQTNQAQAHNACCNHGRRVRLNARAPVYRFPPPTFTMFYRPHRPPRRVALVSFQDIWLEPSFVCRDYTAPAGCHQGASCAFVHVRVDPAIVRRAKNSPDISRSADAIQVMFFSGVCVTLWVTRRRRCSEHWTQ